MNPINIEQLKKDSRLNQMDPDRLSLLLDFANELAGTPDNRKLSCFLSISKRVATQNVQFSPAEQDLLLSVLTEGMSPEEKQKAEMIRNLAARMPRGKQ